MGHFPSASGTVAVRAWRNGRRARLRIWCLWRKSSSLFARTKFDAVVAQLVERHLAKVEVAGPSPVYRSKRKSLLFMATGEAFLYTDRPEGGIFSSCQTPLTWERAPMSKPLDGKAPRYAVSFEL